MTWPLAGRGGMSDRIDNTDKIIFVEVARGLAAVRSQTLTKTPFQHPHC